MDGLSVAASVIAVLQATGTVISLCYDFRAVLNDAPRPLTSILEEATELRSILEKLEQISRHSTPDVKRGQTTLDALQMLCDPAKGPLVITLREVNILEEILKKCKPPGRSDSKWRAWKETVRMWLNDDKIKAHLERIQRCKQTLNLALNADETMLLLDLREMAISLDSTVAAVDQNVTEIASHLKTREVESKHRDLLRWLCPSSPTERHDTLLSSLAPDTCKWLLQNTTFEQWTQANNTLLWLTGPPGTGKTSLFTNTVSYCSTQDTELLTAYSYCDFRDQDASRTAYLLGSLVAQLCRNSEMMPDALLNEYNASNVGGQRIQPRVATLQKAICKISTKRPVCLLIDAIDECPDSTLLADIVNELLASQSPIKLFLTSRQMPELSSHFKEYARIKLEDHRQQQNTDIRLYMEARLQSDARLLKLSENMRSEVSGALYEKADGMFRWAQCQLDNISTLRTPRAIRSSLGDLPAGLHETYANILRRVAHADVDIVRKMLLWLAFSFGPLSIDKLREALAIELDTDDIDEDYRLSSTEDVLAICGSLVAVSAFEKLRLAHLSVVDYLLSDAIKSDRSVAKFALTQSEANHDLLLDCLTYLSFCEMAKGPCQSAGRFAWRVNQYPLLRYAAVAWPHHYRACKDPPNERVLRFLEDEKLFTSWIQVLIANTETSWAKYPRHATPLYYAASFGLLDIVRALIEKGVDLDVQAGRYGGTAVQAAVFRRHVPVLRALLEAGADPNVPDFRRTLPCHYASAVGDEELLRLLVEYGANGIVQHDLSDSLSD